MKNLPSTLFLIAALGGEAWGNAFNVNEHDAKSAGRGVATAASNTDPSSIAFNPGGIPIAEGTQVMVDATLYIGEGEYQPISGDDVTTDSPPRLVPSVFATTRLSETFAVGLGIHAPFGLNVSWPVENPQAEILQDADLATVFITPAVGANLDQWVPGLSVGAGLDLVPALIELERRLLFGDVVGSVDLGATAFGVGGRVGVMYHPPGVPGLKLGVMYRSPVELDFEGDVDFDIAQPYRGALPPDGDAAATITLPQQVWGGIAYSPITNLELEADVVWMRWSETFENDELRIELPGTTMGMPNVTVSPDEYDNTWTFRFGAEYALTEQHAAVRAGYVYDPTPISRRTLTAELPDANRHILTVGGSYFFEGSRYALHASFLYIIPSTRSTSTEPFMPFFKGDYQVTAYVPSLSVSGEFGRL
jgi:long-chain fatty acid transport protein